MGKILTKRILVVATNPEELELLRAYLKKQMAEYDIIAVSNGKEAFRIAIDMDVSAILTDARMHGFSGLDLLRHVKRFRFRVPVLLMASYKDVEVAVQAIKLGANDVLEKPVCNKMYLAARAIRNAITDPAGSRKPMR